MHRKSKFLVHLCWMTLLSACSGGLGVMDSIMESWKGAPLQEAITQWGYPSQEQIIAGHRLYHWHYTQSFTPPATTTGTISAVGDTAYINSMTTGGHTISGICTRTLEVDKNDIVIATEWSGGNCPMLEVMRYANWRRKQP